MRNQSNTPLLLESGPVSSLGCLTMISTDHLDSMARWICIRDDILPVSSSSDGGKTSVGIRSIHDTEDAVTVLL